MSTTRPFAYNTGSTIEGTIQVGTLSVGVSEQDYSVNLGGVKWWMGPDEDLGYVIAKSVPSNTQPTEVGVTASVGFERTSSKTDELFIELSNRVVNQGFTGATQASSWLTDNGYWNSYIGYDVTPTPTPTPTPTIATPTPTPTITATPTLSYQAIPTSGCYQRTLIDVTSEGYLKYRMDTCGSANPVDNVTWVPVGQIDFEGCLEISTLQPTTVNNGTGAAAVFTIIDAGISCATPTPTPTPTRTSTPTPTLTPTPTNTVTPTNTLTNTPTPTPSVTTTSTPTPTPSAVVTNNILLENGEYLLQEDNNKIIL
jgi:hypothetical protein